MGVSSMEALTFPPFSLSWPDYRDEVERVYLSALALKHCPRECDEGRLSCGRLSHCALCKNAQVGAVAEGPASSYGYKGLTVMTPAFRSRSSLPCEWCKSEHSVGYWSVIWDNVERFHRL